MVDLAVGNVIGAAFTGVVQALVLDFMTPLIGLVAGKSDFSTFVVTVRDARFAVGDFLNALLSFLLVAVVIYFLIVLPVNKLMERYRLDWQPLVSVPRSSWTSTPRASAMAAREKREKPTTRGRPVSPADRSARAKTMKEWMR